VCRAAYRRGRSPTSGREHPSVARLRPTASIVALAACLLAAGGGRAAPTAVSAFYLTALAVPMLLGAAFMAYLALVDEVNAWRCIELTVTAVAGLLVMVEAAVRFPSVLADLPPTAGPLSTTAAAIAAGGCAIPALRRVPRLRRAASLPAPVRALLSR
jgi:hypothetical protein